MQLAAHYTWHVTESNGCSSLWPGLAFSANKLLCEMHFREFSLGEKDIFPSLYGLHRIVSIVTKAIVQLLSLWNRFLNVHLMCEEKKDDPSWPEDPYRNKWVCSLCGERSQAEACDGSATSKLLISDRKQMFSPRWLNHGAPREGLYNIFQSLWKTGR